MRSAIRTGLVGLFAVALAASAAVIPGDARRGSELFQNQRCIACHSVRGQGGNSAPDLARSIGRAWTPSLLASLMWNHAPAMWPAMSKAGIQAPRLTEQQAADLYAYLYAFRFFEDPGDAARGSRAFTSKGCAGCHSISGAPPAGSSAPAVAQWESIGDAIALARAMWNHAPFMREAMSARNIAIPTLTNQEMTDLVVYLRNLPQARPAQPAFAPAAATTGADLFRSKGCATCHAGTLSLENRFQGRTLAAFAAAMWNHSPKMIQLPPALSAEEMRALVGYLWSIQYFEPNGDANRGQRVFNNKKCAACHADANSGAPALANKDLNSISMVAVLWTHGPTMLERMRQRNIDWPEFRNRELADLIAYINTLK